MSAIVTIDHLSYIYNEGMPDATTALDDVSFEIEEGQFIGVIGSTGCGKSTLIGHFNGINRPTRGRVLIGGQDIWANPKDIRRFRFMVGLVFQYPEYQLFEETVYKDIAFGPRNMGLSDQEVDLRVREAAAFVGLKEHHLEKSPFELSGGQKRRVAIAGVLAMRPRVLILDEPTAGLDPKGRDSILGQIKEYHQQEKNTILLVSHSMEDVAKYAGKALVMNQSKLYLYAPVEEVFAHAAEISKMGLGVPQITKIFLGLADRGYPVSRTVYTVEQGKQELLRLMKEGGKGTC